MPPNKSARKLMERLKDLAKEILEHTAGTSSCLDTGKAEELLGILKRRQELMEEFDAVAAALREIGEHHLPGAESGPAVLAGAGEGGVLQEEIESILRRALELEAENVRRAERSLAAAKAALEEFYRHKSTWQAYRDEGGIASGCFVDTKK